MSESFCEQFGEKVNQLSQFLTLRNEIEKAQQLVDFRFATSNPPDFLKKKEPNISKIFTFSFCDKNNIYSLLKALQLIGFDPFITIGSYPKGEKFTLIHGDITYLTQGLNEKRFPLINHLVVRNKLRFDPQHGRLHVRFYTLEGFDDLVASAHIDPPDIRHFNLIAHMTNKVKTDYPSGEDLFEKTISLLAQTSQ